MPGPLLDRVAQGHPPPRRGEVDRLARRARSCVVPSTSVATVGDQRLELARRVLVVGVGLVPLEHRELGVVLVRDPLVAEVLAELVDLVDPADDEPLQVELGGDPQVEVAVEGVVVGGERPGERAAVERLEHRRLHLDEATGVEPAPDLRDRLGPLQEELAGLLVRHQVELAPAVAGLDVLEAVELLRAAGEGSSRAAPRRRRGSKAPPSSRRRRSPRSRRCRRCPVRADRS